jgi:hypothetical protein
VRIVRALLLTAGVVSWVLWLQAANRHAPADRVFVLWLGSLLGFGAAFFSRWRVAPPTSDAVWLLGIMFLATLPRAVLLADLPYGVAGDETRYPVDGQELLRHYTWNLFGQSGPSGGVPNLIVVLCAWPTLFMDPLLGARIAALLLGVGSLVTTYLLARQLFDRTVALVASAMLGAWYWHIVFSRLSYPTIQPPFFAPLVLFLAVVAIERGHRFLQLLAGMLFGLGVLVYTPTRIALPVFGLWMLHRQLARRLAWRSALGALVIIAIGLALVLSPYVHDAGLFAPFQRFWETSMAGVGPLRRAQDAGWSGPQGWAVLMEQLRAAAQVYVVGRGVFSPHDYAPGPLLDRVSLGLIVLFLGFALRSPRHGGRFLLLGWVVLTFFVAQVLTDLPEGGHRAGVMLPALAIAAADALVSVCRRVPWRWLASETKVRGLCIALIVVVIWPLNYAYLSKFFVLRSSDQVTALARLVRSGPADVAYHILSSQRLADSLLFRFVGGGRERYDTLSLTDALGSEFDPTRDAVLIIDPLLTSALSAVRRCYPGAYIARAEGAALAVHLSRGALSAGQGCRDRPGTFGLQATYFRDDNWEGEPVLRRIEDWPVRFSYDLTRTRGAQWEGSLRVQVPGVYRLQTVFRDATGNAVVGAAIMADSEPVTVTLGDEAVPIRLRCRPLTTEAFCWLRWEPPGGRWEAIAPELLRPDVAE